MKKITVAVLIFFVAVAVYFLNNVAGHWSAVNRLWRNDSLSYNFEQAGILQEAGSFEESPHDVWWLNSGAQINFGGGVGRTLLDTLTDDSPWLQRYRASNPTDTEQGKYPQNIFRLLTKSIWGNIRQEIYFRILKNNFSDSENRNESNGLLLISRYKDSQNFYYAGIRVDGNVAIKKKVNGEYKVLALKQIFPGQYKRDSMPSLLPRFNWVGIRSEVFNVEGDKVKIIVYIDRNRDGKWVPIIEAVDDGKQFGPLLDSGHGGIRIDFMDAELDDYRAEEI